MKEMEIIVKNVAMDTQEYQEAFELRNEILRKPRGLDLHNEVLPYEKVSHHSAAFCGDQVMGAVCWYEENGKGIVKHLAVSEKARGLGIGKKLLVHAENEMRTQQLFCSRLKARVSAQPFYEKCGYHAEGGIMADDVPHIMMEKDLN